jgi:hypothetical protein
LCSAKTPFRPPGINLKPLILQHFRALATVAKTLFLGYNILYFEPSVFRLKKYPESSPGGRLDASVSGLKKA